MIRSMVSMSFTNVSKRQKRKQKRILISRAIAKFHLNDDIVCYWRDSTDLYKEKNVGEIIYTGAFMSTSLKLDGAHRGKHLTVVIADKGSRCAFIGLISRHKHQKEVLFDKSCKFRIVSKQEGVTFLEVTK